MKDKRAYRRLRALFLAGMLLLGGCAGGGDSGTGAVTGGDAVETIAVAEAAQAALPASAFPVNEPTGAANEIVVSTVDEFLAAIGSDRTVYLQPGDYDLTKAKDYGQPTASLWYNWTPCNDGFELSIEGVEKLTILGHSAADVTLVTSPRYANVMAFSNCSGVSVQGVTAGHAEGPGNCSGAVLYLESTDAAIVRDCDLYWCGTLGLSMWDCEDVTATNCTVRECSLGGMQVIDSQNVRLEDSRIVNCGSRDDPAFFAVSISQSNAVAVVGCTVENNVCLRLLDSAYSKDVQLLGNAMRGNTVAEAMLVTVHYSPVIAGCAFTDNTAAQWYADPAGAGEAYMEAVDRDGKALSEEDLLAMRQESVPYAAPTSPPDDGPTPTPAASDSPDGMREVQADTVDALLAAIAPNTTVYLADGVYDLSNAVNYGAYGGENYHWVNMYDGPGLVVRDVANFHIVSGGADKVFLHASPRYADVIAYEWCENVSVTGVTLGHAEAPGECCGGVLRFTDTDTVTVRDCGLFGCGVFGIDATDCRAFTVVDTEIYDCSDYGVSLSGCEDMAFDGCHIHDCGKPMFRTDRSTNVTVDGKAVE